MSEAPMDGRGTDPISDYLAVMTGTAPVGTTDAADAARVRDGIHVLTQTNASSKRIRKLDRPPALVRILRAGAWLVVLLAAIWIGGNVYGYVTAGTMPSPISVGMWALGFVAAVVLVEIRRRRKIAWY
jgi:hypothetical protein